MSTQLKFINIIGARPQFIKAAVMSDAIYKYNNSTRHSRKHEIDEVVIHTGQHYDSNMSDIFFQELGLPLPKYNLGVSGGSHGEMTGRMIEKIEEVLLKEMPDLVLTYGDTNSTIAAALASCKLRIPVAHVEAGLRSGNFSMPEEVNRKVTDQLSTFLFCPSECSLENLVKEGFPYQDSRRRNQVLVNSGDVMYDLRMLLNERILRETLPEEYGLNEKSYVLVTIHREENTDKAGNLREICEGLRELAATETVVFVLHPRTHLKLKNSGLYKLLTNVKLLEPLSYIKMQRMQLSSRAVMTDSGGVQKEAFFNKVPCLTIREESEWPETIQSGWNKLVSPDKERILYEFRRLNAPLSDRFENPYGDGKAASRIIDLLTEAEHFCPEKGF